MNLGNFSQKSQQKHFIQKELLKVFIFDNLKLDMYKDQLKDLFQEKIRVRNYPNADDKNYYLETKFHLLKADLKQEKLLLKMNLKI